MREEGRGKREEGRGKREEGRGKREEGRGKGCGMRRIKTEKSKARAMRFRGCLVTDGWAKRALVGWLVSRAACGGAHRYNKDGDENPKVWR